MIDHKSSSDASPFLLMSAVGISGLGSSLTAFAMGVRAFHETGSYESYALIGLLSTLSVLLFAPIAGYVSDRFPKHMILMSSDCVAIAAASVLATVSYLQVLNLLWIAFGVLCLSVAAEFRYTVTGALLHAIASQDQLPRAVSLQQVFRGLTIMFAPLLGAVLYETFGIEMILAIDVATFVFCIAVVLRLRLSSQAVLNVEQVGFWSGLSAGIRWVINSPVHRRLLNIFLAFTTGMALFNACIGPYMLANGTATDLGAISSAMGAGMFSAGVVLTSRSFGDRMWDLLYGSCLVLALCFVAWGIIDIHWAHLGLAGIVGASLAALSTNCLSLWQTHTPQELQGKVLAVRSSAMYAFSPLAIVVSVPVITSLLIPLMSTSPLLQWVWGQASQRSAIGLFISILGMVLSVLTLIIMAKRVSFKAVD